MVPGWISTIAVMYAIGLVSGDQPNYDTGYCYYCDAPTNPALAVPPLCVSECRPAINSLCGSSDSPVDLSVSHNATNKNCQVLYKPAVYEVLRDGAHAKIPSSDECKATYEQILSTCVSTNGAKPHQGALGEADEQFCTKAGGGGTFGWKDDGWVMEDTARYIISSTSTAHCGQTKAFWHDENLKLVTFPNFGIKAGEQIAFGSPNPPSPPPAVPQVNPEDVKPNQECGGNTGTQCTFFNKPYYAMKGKDPWKEGGKDDMRHQIVYNGFSDEDDASQSSKMFNSLYDRCGKYPGNFQGYLDGSHRVIDFDLYSPGKDMCRCIEDAIFDASGGLVVPEKEFCSSSTHGNVASLAAQFFNVPVHDELRH
ncbi:uncharacterized protein KY384_006735 [Bacidia gigantensis]|uniref:uncharacterized protein n=1 Tax=Bacidia gigantensis TaxID=2732470 RepID=UPI001D03B215|nr:uncharacterized protein KY384_006735 [Bacidia gigantensis]KAG8528563.1 hypothetical protein KY384_006735 [Bacidia gigantensis]